MAELVIQSPLNKVRKDKFRLTLTIPNILKPINTRLARNNDFINLDSLQFSVHTVNLPEIGVPAVQLHFAGQTHNVSSYDRPAYPPATVGFTIDNEFKNYWVIWKWLQLFNDQIHGTYGGPNMFTGIGGEYPKMIPELLFDYATMITLDTLDEYNDPVVQWTYRHAFPVSLGGINHSFRDPEEIDTTFSFAYNQLDLDLIQK